MCTLGFFKIYNVRARVDNTLTAEIAYWTGPTLAKVLSTATVVVGRDVRESSPGLLIRFSKGICNKGANIIDIGLRGTEEV